MVAPAVAGCRLCVIRTIARPAARAAAAAPAAAGPIQTNEGVGAGGAALVAVGRIDSAVAGALAGTLLGDSGSGGGTGGKRGAGSRLGRLVGIEWSACGASGTGNP